MTSRVSRSLARALLRPSGCTEPLLARTAAKRECVQRLSTSTEAGAVNVGASDGDDASKGVRKGKKVRGPPTPYILRTQTYQQQMKLLRKQFIAEQQRTTTQPREKIIEARKAAAALREERKEKKRKKSEEVFQKVLAERAAEREHQEQRRVIQFKHWQERAQKHEEGRQAVIQRLNASADTWVTEENLDEKVAELLDSIFVSEDVLHSARRESKPSGLLRLTREGTDSRSGLESTA